MNDGGSVSRWSKKREPINSETNPIIVGDINFRLQTDESPMKYMTSEWLVAKRTQMYKNVESRWYSKVPIKLDIPRCVTHTHIKS